MLSVCRKFGQSLATVLNSRSIFNNQANCTFKGGQSPTKALYINYCKYSISDIFEMGQGQSTPGGGNKEKKVCDQRRSLDDCTWIVDRLG